MIRLGEHQAQRTKDATHIAELEAEKTAIYDALVIDVSVPTLACVRNLKHFNGMLNALDWESTDAPKHAAGV